jgi:hypothetical protein
VFFPRNNKSVIEKDLSPLSCSDCLSVKGTGRATATPGWLSITK